jgi:DNA gyrase subunit A
MPDVRDESDTEKGTRIVLDLRRDADAAHMLSQLFQETDLQVPLSFQMVFLFGEPMQAARQPKQVGMIELLNYWNTHQIDVLTRRSQFELRKARERLHIVEGLIVGAAHADQIVRIFQQAEDRTAARAEIERQYKLTTIQSEVIASMTLAQVTRLDAGKYAKEQAELQARIAELERLLADRKALIALLKKEMQQRVKLFGDERRTLIDVEGKAHSPIEAVASLHQREPLMVVFTRSGTLKALPAGTFSPKGKHKTYTVARGDEQVRQVFETTSQDYLLGVSSQGRVFQLATHAIPFGTRTAKGELVQRLLKLEQGEQVVGFLPVTSYDEEVYLVTFSRLGKVKKTPVREYKTVDVDGAQDMKLANGDSIVAALLSSGQGEYVVTTNTAQTLRFSDEQLRAQGRVGQGVAAIALGPGVTVVSASSLDEGQHGSTSLLVVTENSFIKKVPVEQFPQKGRATAGVVATELLERDRVLATMLVHDDDVLLMQWRTEQGEKGERGEQVVAMKAFEVKSLPRAKRGMPLFNGRMIGVVKL